MPGAEAIQLDAEPTRFQRHPFCGQTQLVDLVDQAGIIQP